MTLQRRRETTVPANPFGKSSCHIPVAHKVAKRRQTNHGCARKSRDISLDRIGRHRNAQTRNLLCISFRSRPYASRPLTSRTSPTFVGYGIGSLLSTRRASTNQTEIQGIFPNRQRSTRLVDPLQEDNETFCGANCLLSVHSFGVGRSPVSGVVNRSSRLAVLRTKSDGRNGAVTWLEVLGKTYPSMFVLSSATSLTFITLNTWTFSYPSGVLAIQYVGF